MQTGHIIGSIFDVGLNLSHEFFAAFSSLVYPPFCCVCERDLRAKENLVCERCWSSLELIDRPFCPQCGAPLSTTAETCFTCSEKKFAFTGARAAFRYTEDVRTVIHALKFHRKTSLAKRLGRILAFAVLQDARYQGIDCFVPVPLHPSRGRERGFNQSDLLTEHIAAELDVACLNNVLVRRKRTKAQTALNFERRQRNVEKAFAVTRSAELEGKRVVIVDDVFTTGATLNACALALREAGAADVLALTAARAC